MTGLLSLSDNFDSRDSGRLTRSPITTAVALVIHYDVIPGLHLVVDLLCFSRSDLEVHNELKFAQTHHWTNSTCPCATIHKQPLLDLNEVITGLREFSSRDLAQA